MEISKLPWWPKSDIKDGYRIVSVYIHRHLLGIQWLGATYIDGALPIGVQSTPKILSVLADLLQWIIIDQSHAFVIHYLDDFLLVGPPESSQCTNTLER